MRRALIYCLLLAGATVFAWPFLWLAFTSAKLQPELFSDHPAGPPEAPRPVLQSPYVDDRLFAEVDGARRDEALQMIAKNLRSGNYNLPADLDPARLMKQLELGIYQRCLTVFPGGDWNNERLRTAERVSAD